MEKMKKPHIPVLLEEVMQTLGPREGERYLDLTAGFGGHAEKILAATRNYKDAVLVDRDREAAEFLGAEFPDVQILNTDFYSAVLRLIECGKKFDLILMDIGVSSLQLDKTERGFSFSREAPLDMRMDRTQELSADLIVNHWSEKKLAEIFEKYGEESYGRAKMLAREIVMNRPIRTTTELADVIAKKSRHSKIHPATRIFQAIRIVVNDELSELEKTLPLAVKLLEPQGRLGVISFHSLEDRIVKQFFREAAGFGEESEIKILTPKPIVAGKMELVINPRARSAKLRVVRKG